MASSARIDELKKKFDENPRRYFAPLANEYRKVGDLDQAMFICEAYLPQQPGHMSGHIVYAPDAVRDGAVRRCQGRLRDGAGAGSRESHRPSPPRRHRPPGGRPQHRPRMVPARARGRSAQRRDRRGDGVAASGTNGRSSSVADGLGQRRRAAAADANAGVQHAAAGSGVADSSRIGPGVAASGRRLRGRRTSFSTSTRW